MEAAHPHTSSRFSYKAGWVMVTYAVAVRSILIGILIPLSMNVLPTLTLSVRSAHDSFIVGMRILTDSVTGTDLGCPICYCLIEQIGPLCCPSGASVRRVLAIEVTGCCSCTHGSYSYSHETC